MAQMGTATATASADCAEADNERKEAHTQITQIAQIGTTERLASADCADGADGNGLATASACAIAQ